MRSRRARSKTISSRSQHPCATRAETPSPRSAWADRARGSPVRGTPHSWRSCVRQPTISRAAWEHLLPARCSCGPLRRRSHNQPADRMNRPILRCALSFLAFAAVAGCAAGSTPGVSANLVGSGPGSGTLFIVGGGAQPPELVARFVELAGANPRIAVVPMASGSAEEGGREKAEQLRSLGADAFSLNITKEQANSDSVVRLIESATGIWF